MLAIGGLMSIQCNLPEQSNPFPMVKGGWHSQEKLPLSNPSLLQTAFTSHGSLWHGSGTTQ